MEITGRLTANAEVRNVKENRQVVNFTIADNDHYKTKDGEKKTVTTFFNCSYWISTKVAENLTKGAIVQLTGRLSVNAYSDTAGEPKASLNFHVNGIKFLGGGKSIAATTEQEQQQNTQTPESVDDLPF